MPLAYGVALPAAEVARRVGVVEPQAIVLCDIQDNSGRTSLAPAESRGGRHSQLQGRTLRTAASRRTGYSPAWLQKDKRKIFVTKVQALKLAKKSCTQLANRLLVVADGCDQLLHGHRLGEGVRLENAHKGFQL